MPTFDELVRLAAQNSDVLALQPVVEKELLHHEILRSMAEADLLHQLTFIGGTCLRACYGSNRLSEDLDFTGGISFTADDLRQLGQIVRDGVRRTYDLPVEVTEPTRTAAEVGGRVQTWKMHMLTHPGSKHLPQQRIHIDICAVSSFERQPTVLRNHYGIDLGTSGLIIQAESRNEILADTMLALALRPNRMKQRDLWDITWLVQQGESCDSQLVWRKCDERGVSKAALQSNLSQRLAELPSTEQAFQAEMQRFLPRSIAATSIAAPGFWRYLCDTVSTCAHPLLGQAEGPVSTYSM
ncbi:MAG: nucleotidyl transferase AbiEii/AbiGii toxin family protein [Planctomycetota bacterium]|nr:MAG: nucleotidyl transferase AbiEii/AbiGii toxin family protein [Planctomycetota bacterium]